MSPPPEPVGPSVTAPVKPAVAPAAAAVTAAKSVSAPPTTAGEPLATLGWTAADWRAAAIAVTEDGRKAWNPSHLARLQSLAVHIAREAADASSSDRAWIAVATPAQIEIQWTSLVLRYAESTDYTLPPLFGVPVAIKDNIDVVGFPTTAACPGFAYSPTEHATVVQRLVDAGAIVVGKTNLDQFATGLVGTRSPVYGAVANALGREKKLAVTDTRISGGSSSGSAVAVARGLVPLALGTDTAGSGRVPAGFNNIIGVKPTRGRLSARGVVPACKSLDTASIFAATLADAHLALAVTTGFDYDDAYSRHSVPVPPPRPWTGRRKVAVPRDPVFAALPSTPDADVLARGAFERTCRQFAEVLDVELVPVDFAPLHQLAALLYEGPWVAERWAAIGEYVRTVGKEMDPTVLKIVRGAERFSATDCFAAEYKAQSLRRAIATLLAPFDAVLVPTTPCPAPTFSDIAAEPVSVNATLGTYTNFVNLADLCGLALPAGYLHGHAPADADRETLAFGITLLAPAWHEERLLELGADWLAVCENGTRRLGATDRRANAADHDAVAIVPTVPTVKLAVVGAHLRGMPLHRELTVIDARLVAATATAPKYRLYALPGTTPPKPGLVRVADDDETGVSIAIEVYEVTHAALGTFTAGVPAPLAIGNVETAAGEWVKGFVCEPAAVRGATDVSPLGGWRTYMSSLGKPVPLFTRVLVANRGEIAVRATRTLQRLGVRAIAVFAESDRYSAHVAAADTAILLPADVADAASTYLDVGKILRAAARTGAQAVWPGYGFLSENPEFAAQCEAAGLVFIGPTPDQMRIFAHKHTAKSAAAAVGVPQVPASPLLRDVAHAQAEAIRIGYPVMLKCTAGGGGIGLVRVDRAEDMPDAMRTVQRMGMSYFGDGAVFVEKCVLNARHFEVQVMGDGKGNVVALGERDCTLQRRHQKVIEEAPAPELPNSVRADLIAHSIRLMRSVKYRGAGTVEFIYDVQAREVYFLEVNARLQHPVTEAIMGIDLVEWMVQIAADHDMRPAFRAADHDMRPAFRAAESAAASRGDSSSGTAIEVRVYAEDPAHGFRPSPGKLGAVDLPASLPGVRVDTWISSGITVPAAYDPLLAKLIVHGATRADAIARMQAALAATRIDGIVTNLEYLRAVVASSMFTGATFTTKSLDTFSFAPAAAISVIAPGTATSVQDFPGRVGRWDVGVPPSGPMDALAFRVANRIVANAESAAALECTLAGPVLEFAAPAVVAMTGAAAPVTLDGKPADMWTPISVAPGQRLAVGTPSAAGCRTYVAVRGGIDVPKVLGSRATFALGETGGVAGRVLRAGDRLAVGDEVIPPPAVPAPAPAALIPAYPASGEPWTLAALVGPHAAPDYLTPRGLAAFLAAEWRVGHNANRLGVRLTGGPKPEFARATGGEAGLHPSNVHDCPYAIGSVNLTGDHPTILTQDGPSLGGFVCPITIAEVEMWKVGQLRPGDRVRFELVAWDAARDAQRLIDEGVRDLKADATLGAIAGSGESKAVLVDMPPAGDRPRTVYRQAGDRALLIEYGDDTLDLRLRFRVHALMQAVSATADLFVRELVPGVRSLQIQYDASRTTQSALVSRVLELDAALPPVATMRVPSRVVRLPIAFDDAATRDTVTRYVATVRGDAPYLPSNTEFLRRANGLDSTRAVQDAITASTYLVLGLGDVYYGAPCAVPLDVRHRLKGAKYNPARTYTAEGVVGIGGMYMCIYGVASPGGYQLVGRTLPVWDDVQAARPVGDREPWMLRFFDQVKYYRVAPDEIERLRAGFRHARANGRDVADLVKIEETEFHLGEYLGWLDAHRDEIEAAEAKRNAAFDRELARWGEYESRLAAADPAVSRKSAANDVFPESWARVTAGLASRTWKVLVAEGDAVEAGQTLILVEAMKAEVPVVAPRGGTARAVRCRPGDDLAPEDVVVVIE
ncbi:hypothetical protein H9P43_002173 [Blastocladiella emersonii ATCC 22665]|nr:hypothetical protein H9P43_002173 [Blastocladiella emersonii ATCC 22665]